MNCKNCNSILHIKRNKFCSKSCSASFNNSLRIRSDKSKQKTSESMKINYKNNPRPKYRSIHYINCENCDEIFVSPRKSKKTCSNQCRNKLIQKSAINQKIHGGGKKGYYNGILCDSTWELAFLIYHLDHKMDIRRNDQQIEYVHKEKLHSYTPDFIVESKLYEIKGFHNERSISKQLAAKNLGYNIELIDKTKISYYINYVKTKYNVKNLVELYDDAICEKMNCFTCDKEIIKTSDKTMFCSRSCAGKFRQKERKLKVHSPLV